MPAQYRCRICSQLFEIPPDAVAIGVPTTGRYQLYRFKNGVVHDLREVSEVRTKN